MHSPGAGEYWAAAPARPALRAAPSAARPGLGLAPAPARGSGRPRGPSPACAPAIVPASPGSAGLCRLPARAGSGAGGLRPPAGRPHPPAPGQRQARGRDGGPGPPVPGPASHHPHSPGGLTGDPGGEGQPPRALGGGGAPGRKVWKRWAKGRTLLSWGHTLSPNISAPSPRTPVGRYSDPLRWGK